MSQCGNFQQLQAMIIIQTRCELLLLAISVRFKQSSFEFGHDITKAKSLTRIQTHIMDSHKTYLSVAQSMTSELIQYLQI